MKDIGCSFAMIKGLVIFSMLSFVGVGMVYLWVYYAAYVLVALAVIGLLFTHGLAGLGGVIIARLLFKEGAHAAGMQSTAIAASTKAQSDVFNAAMRLRSNYESPPVPTPAQTQGALPPGEIVFEGFGSKQYEDFEQ